MAANNGAQVNPMTLADLPSLAIENVIDQLGVVGLGRVTTQVGPFDESLDTTLDDETINEYTVFKKFCHERQFPFTVDNNHPLTTQEYMALFKKVKDTLGKSWHDIEQNYLYLPTAVFHKVNPQDVTWQQGHVPPNVSIPPNAKRGDVIKVGPTVENSVRFNRYYVYDGSKLVVMDDSIEDSGRMDAEGVIPASFAAEFPLHYWIRDDDLNWRARPPSMSHFNLDREQLAMVETFYYRTLGLNGHGRAFMDVQRDGRTYRIVNNGQSHRESLKNIIACQNPAHKEFKCHQHDESTLQPCNLALKVYRYLPLPDRLGHYAFDLVPLTVFDDGSRYCAQIHDVKMLAMRNAPDMELAVPIENVLLIGQPPRHCDEFMEDEFHDEMRDLHALQQFGWFGW